MKHIRTLIAAVAMLVVTDISAQMARLYTSDSGLPNSKINSIYQDSRGFIWISTENGLSRFDGMGFSTFHHDRSNSNSIASDLVLTVFEDSGRTYWVGTSAGLQVFDSEYSTFTKINLHDNEVAASDQHISAITEVTIGEERKIIAASSGHGIYIIDPLTKETDIQMQEVINPSLPSQFIRRIFKDSSERLWISAEDGGISIFNLKKGFISEEAIWDEEMEYSSKSVVITSFAEDVRSGKILLGTSNHGLLIYDPSTGRIRMPSDHDARSCMVETILKNNIMGNYENTTFLIGLENNGIKLFNAAEETLSDVQIPGVGFDTSTWKVHSLIEDSQGNVWVGAFQTGIMVIPRSMYGFESISLGSHGHQGTDEACVTSVITDNRNGGLWVGTDGAGLFRIDRNGNKECFSSNNSGLSNNSIMSLVMDKRGTLWVATYLGGLFRWTEESGFRQFRDQESISSNRVICLTYSKDDDLLYVGTHGNGMSIVSPSEEEVICIYDEDSNKWISNLYIDNDGLIWVGTYNGAMCYDRKTGSLNKLEIDEFLDTRIHSFCEDSNGNIWIGTGEGLVCLNKASRQRDLFTEKDGLPSNIIEDIEESSDGNIWIATMNGLSRYSPVNGTFKNYYHYDGLQANEFHARASYCAEDGRMFFGGIKGLTTFYPHIVDRDTRPVPPLYFSDLKVMNEPVDYNPSAGEDNILDKHITEATRLTLPYDENIFSIKFTVLEYTNPRKIMYAYMMEGFDSDWNYIGQDSRIVTYTNLPAGKYTLKAKAFFEGSPDKHSYREISIRIMPPWYKTIWACLMYLLLTAFAIYGLAQWKKREERAKREKEESAIKELKLEMFTNISHEIRTPLTLVMNPLKKMREAEKDPKQKDLYNLMYRNSLRILRLVNQLLDMRKIDSGQMQLHFLETDVVYFIKDIMKSFDNLAVSKNIRFTIVPHDDVRNLWIDQGNFDKIIFNLLSNAFKYTPENGTISISISEVRNNHGVLEAPAEKYVEFVIENSGSSVDERYLDKVFDRFFQADVRDAKVGSGVGLNLSKMLVELHHGDIKAYNTDDGMAFSVRIPAGCQHLSAEEMTKPTNHKDLYTKDTAHLESLHTSREDVTYTRIKEEPEKIKETKSKRKIILIDDDEEMRSYLKLELQSMYNIEVCSNGKEGWKKITTTIPDAIVTDLMMEGMDGAELCDKVKKNPGTNHIPVIILTSSSDEMSQQRCIDCGADRFFTKPISLEILKSTIANAISTRVTIRNKYNKEIDYGYNEIKMPDTSNKLVTKVIETIRKNMENSDFSVEDLSREVGMSRVHLNRKLKETMNISPSNLIRSIRLKQAAFLLINNKVNISEVAYKVGFSTHSYFSNSFHDYFGMTPKEFVAKYMDCKDEETLKRFFE